MEPGSIAAIILSVLGAIGGGIGVVVSCRYARSRTEEGTKNKLNVKIIQEEEDLEGQIKANKDTEERKENNPDNQARVPVKRQIIEYFFETKEKKNQDTVRTNVLNKKNENEGEGHEEKVPGKISELGQKNFNAAFIQQQEDMLVRMEGIINTQNKINQHSERSQKLLAIEPRPENLKTYSNPYIEQNVKYEYPHSEGSSPRNFHQYKEKEVKAGKSQFHHRKNKSENPEEGSEKLRETSIELGMAQNRYRVESFEAYNKDPQQIHIHFDRSPSVKKLDRLQEKEKKHLPPDTLGSMASIGNESNDLRQKTIVEFPSKFAQPNGNNQFSDLIKQFNAHEGTNARSIVELKGQNGDEAGE